MRKMDSYIPQIKLSNFIKDQLFCLCDDCNCILSINLNTLEAKYVGKLEDEYSFQFSLSCRSIVYKNNILYSPYYSKNIHFFDCEKKKDNIIACSSEIDIGEDRYCALLQDGSSCYLIPYIGKNILEIDMENKQVIRKIDIYNALKEKGLRIDNNNFSESDGYRYKNKYYISIENLPFIAELDVKNDSYEAFRLEGLSDGLCGIAGLDNILYIYSKESCIITYDIDKKRIVNKVKVLDDNDIFFYGAITIGNDIYFVQMGQSVALKYNTATYTVEYMNFNDKLKNIQSGEDFKFIGVIDGNRLVFMSAILNIVIVDLEYEKYEYKQVKCNIDDLENNIRQNAYFQSKNIEYSKLALPCYIQYKKYNNVNKRESYVGTKIYHTIINELEGTL